MNKILKLSLILLINLLLAINIASAQNAADEGWNLHFQTTGVYQAHPDFHANYSGENSLPTKRHANETLTSTLFLGYKLWNNGELYFNPEAYQGYGLGGDTYGVAGFPNGEATKAGASNVKVATSRLFLRQTINLGGEKQNVASAANQLAGNKNVNNLTFTIGKFAASDIFDNNLYSHDPRAQFFNWSIYSSAAWDFPADARGYTNGLAIEFNQAKWALRYGAFLEPYRANGKRLAYHGTESLGHVAELERSYDINEQPGKIRFLTFFNQARQAKFNDALAATNEDINVALDQSHKYGNKKYGFAINGEQQLIPNLGAFARLSWNDGKTEDWAFTQIDQSIAAGLSWQGAAWQRKNDVVGIAGVINDISKEQRRFLEAGGMGLIIGDGKLNYGSEKILEVYYAIKMNSYFTLTPDYQFITNPGYNKDRGPVNVFGIRAHFEL